MYLSRIFAIALVVSMVVPMNMGLVFAEPQISSNQKEQQQIVQNLEKTLHQKIQSQDKVSKQFVTLPQSLVNKLALKTGKIDVPNVDTQIFSKPDVNILPNLNIIPNLLLSFFQSGKQSFDLGFNLFGFLDKIANVNSIIPNAYADYASQFGSFGSGNGQFGVPYGMTTDSSGNTYVVDDFYNRVQQFNSLGVYQFQFGSTGSGNGQFNSPHGIAIDNSGNIYVVDSGNNRVEKFDSSGNYLSQFGSAGSGNGLFNNPINVALDSSGNIYITDQNNNRVQEFDSSGNYLSQFGSSGSGNGQFNNPDAIVIDSSGNIYVTDDSNQRVQKFNSTENYQLQFGTSGSGNGQFNEPNGISIDNSGNVYVTDFNNNRVQEFSSTGVYLSQFGTYGTGNGQFRSPIGITFDRTGNVYVADGGNHRIQKFSPDVNYKSQFGSHGSGNGQFNHPFGITLDNSGNIYVADDSGNRVEKFDSSGNYLSQFGSTGSSNGQFNNPVYIVIDNSGNVYVTDFNNNRVEKFNSAGTYLSQFGSSGSSNGQFNGPAEITLDASGNIYVTDWTNNRVEKFDSSGNYLSQFGSTGSGNGQFNKPYGIAIDSSGNIYVADQSNNRIEKFNSAGTYLSQFGSAGSGNGQFNGPNSIVIDSSWNIFVTDNNNNRVQEFDSNGNYLSQFGSSGSGNDQFNAPIGLAIDRSGNMYVTDYNNNRVEKFSPFVTSPFILQFGSHGSGNGQFDSPQGIVIDSSGNIYVADRFNNRIEKFNSAGTYLSQFGPGGYGIAIDSSNNIYVDLGNSIEKFNSAGSLVLSFGSSGSGNGQFSNSHYIVIDSSGNILVSDHFNDRVQKFDSSGNYLSQFGTSGSGNGQFADAEGMAIDSSGNIYVMDTDNGRIEKFDSSGNYLSQFGNGQFSNAHGIAIDSSGNIYVADFNNERIAEFNSTGVYQSQFGSSGSGTGQFSTPHDIAIDISGNIYVSDRDNNRVQKFSPFVHYQSQFGSSGSGNGQFNGVDGVAIDSSGNIYVSDENNNRLEEFNSSGIYVNQFGSAGSGNGFFGDPRGVAIDSSGNIYVADHNNNRIEEFSSSRTYLNQFGSTGSGNGQLSGPDGITLDISGNVYVVDQGNNRVEEFSSSGTYLNQFGSFGSGNGQFNSPVGVAIDSSGNIYVTDLNNHRVEEFSSSGTYLNQFGSSGSGNGQFSSPIDIVIDSSGNIHVTDRGNNRVEEFSSSGTYLSQFGSGGSGNDQFNGLSGIAFDRYGNIYVADWQNNRVQKFLQPVDNHPPTISITSPTNTQLFTTSTISITGTAADLGASLQNIKVSIDGGPYLIANGTTSWTFTTSGLSNGVHIINTKATDNVGNIAVTTVPFTMGQAASLAIGQGGFTTGSSGTTISTLFEPFGDAFDSSGNLWVADTSNNRILEYAAPFSIGESASLVIGQPDFTHNLANQGGSVGANMLSSPFGLAFDSSGNLWVADSSNNRILEYTAPFSTGQSASLVIGQTGVSTGGSGTSQSTLNFPRGLAFDSSGNLWIADNGNNRILEYTAPFSTGQLASNVIGQQDYVSYGSGITASTLDGPEGIVFDSTGSMWIADTFNNRMLKFTTPVTTGQPASLVIGQPDFTHNLANQGGSVGANTLRNPQGLAVDSSGNLWVADADNSRILEYTAPFSTGQSSSLAIGQSSFTYGGTSSPSNNNLFQPADITFDSSGNLWVADTENSRMLQYTTSITVAPPVSYSISLSDSLSLSDQFQNPAKDFSISILPNPQIQQGISGFTTLTISSINGFNSPVSLSITSAPAGITGSFSINPVNVPINPSGFSITTLSLNVLSSMAPGTYNATVTGTSGSLIHAETFPITVFATRPIPHQPTMNVLYGTDAKNDNLFTISTVTGAGTIVGTMYPVVPSIPALAIDPTTDIVYAGSGGTHQFIYQVDPVNAQIGLVGDTGLGFGAIHSLAFRSDGILFASIDGKGIAASGGDHLATINKNTGKATIIGSYGTCTGVTFPSSGLGSCTLVNMEGIAFSPSGVLYGVTSSAPHGVSHPPPELYTINTSTGTATPVTTISNSGVSPSGGIASLVFIGNTLYGGTATAISPATDGGQLITINPSTGTYTTVGQTTSGSSLAGLAFSPPLSESVIISDSVSVLKKGPGPAISSIIAFDNTGTNTAYGNGATITVYFAQGTNQPPVSTKSQLDSTFTFSQNLGANYAGQWSSPTTLVITIMDSTGSTPPAVGTLTLTVKSTANLLNIAGTSNPSISQSPTLTGVFGSKLGPFITGLVINDPSGSNAVYANGDTLTVQFSEATNRAIGTSVLNKGSVDSLFTFSQNLGNNYNGQWITPSTFVITILDSTGSTPPAIGTMTASVKSGAGLKNSVGTSLVSTSTSPVMSGHFGNRPGPSIIQLTAGIGTGTPGSYSDGTTMTIRFAEPTNTFDPTPAIQGLSKSDIDTLFTFTQNLGTDYTGLWADPSTLVITVTDSRLATVTIGGLQATVHGNTIRDSSGTSAPSTSTSPVLSGDFGHIAGPIITSLVASDPTVHGAVYSNTDTITVTFAEATNRPGGTAIQAEATVNNMFTFSQTLGTNANAYTGQWINPSTFVITILDATGGTPTIGGLQVTVKSGAGLTNSAGTSLASTSISPFLSGSFGNRPGPFITELTASDPTGTHGVYSTGLTITAQFSENTNQPGGSTVQNKAAVDNMFAFSQNLGNNYNGQWITPSTFVMTILDSTGAQPPTIGGLSVTVKSSANIKNAPGISLVSTSTSPGLDGSFGSRQGPTITNLIADDPTGTHNSYSAGITISAIFSETTNQPGGTSVQNKAAVDNIFTFSQNLGADYTGQWTSSSVFVVTIQDTTGAAPLPSIGVLTASVKQTANLQNAAATSLASTSLSPLLSGTFGTFTVSIPVTDGGSAVATLPSGITTELTLPSGSEGTIQITKSSLDSSQPTGGASINFLGNVANITPQSGASCSTGCGISFTFTQSDADSFGISPFAVKVYHDANEDGIFESNEALSTTVTQTSASTFVATSNVPFNSKFAIGGVVTALAVLGGGVVGGDSASQQTFSADGFINLQTLSQNAKDAIQNQDPYTPILPSNDPTVPYYPFSLDGNNYLIARYANTIQTVTQNVGVPVNLQLASPDVTISHIALYTNMEGLSKEIGDSDTYIVYDKGSPLQIIDPHGYFSNVQIKTTTDNNGIEKFGFSITFAKPLSTSDIFIREWNEVKYSSDTKIKDAIQIIESPQNTQTSKDVIPDKTASESVSSIPSTVSSMPTTGTGDITNYIKEWGGYSPTSISDSQLLGYMGIKGEHIPSWVMKDTKWIVTGDIGQQEFKDAIQYMSEKGIIK